MKLALIITTYERPDALAAVLRSVAGQSVRPDQIIIGDDGSGPETARVIDDARRGGMDIVHEWREHDGFRAARMRNCALARVTGDYVVFIDGDLILHPHFIRDHRAVARPGFFVQGKRVLLDENATRRALAEERYWPSVFARGVERRRHLVRLAFVPHFLPPVSHLKGIRSCNFAAWMDDVRRVNGFNEEFVGWGREDDEFAERLFNAGVRRLNLRCAGIGCHLHHPPHSRDQVGKNSFIVKLTRDAKVVHCRQGLDSHLGNVPAGGGGTEHTIETGPDNSFNGGVGRGAASMSSPPRRAGRGNALTV